MAGLSIAKFVVISVLLAFCRFDFCCARSMSDNIPEGPMTGGVSAIPVDSPEVVKLAKVVADKLSEGDNKERTVVEVVKAGVQVVAGTLTHLILRISDGEQERMYEASIWEQPWLNKTEITKLVALDSECS